MCVSASWLDRFFSRTLVLWQLAPFCVIAIWMDGLTGGRASWYGYTAARWMYIWTLHGSWMFGPRASIIISMQRGAWHTYHSTNNQPIIMPTSQVRGRALRSKAMQSKPTIAVTGFILSKEQRQVRSKERQIKVVQLSRRDQWSILCNASIPAYLTSTGSWEYWDLGGRSKRPP